MILGHGNIWRDDKEGLFKEFAQLARQYERIYFLPNIHDYNSVLRAGDLFIGDNSSLFVDCCQMDKPILHVEHPEFIFSDNAVGELYRNASYSFNNTNDINAVQFKMSSGNFDGVIKLYGVS